MADSGHFPCPREAHETEKHWLIHRYLWADATRNRTTEAPPSCRSQTSSHMKETSRLSIKTYPDEVGVDVGAQQVVAGLGLQNHSGMRIWNRKRNGEESSCFQRRVGMKPNFQMNPRRRQEQMWSKKQWEFRILTNRSDWTTSEHKNLYIKGGKSKN